jgi:hypothetical protein
MNKEQQELLDESYKDYFIKKSSETGPFGVTGIIPTKDEFINNCKNNPEFSEKWGLTIEERDLNVDELNIVNLLKQTSTKLITMTYNDKTIESYE